MQELLYPATSELGYAAAQRAAFLSGEPVSDQVRPEVLSAWTRSRTAEVSPNRDHVPQLLEGPALREYAASHLIYRTGTTVLAAAADQITGTGYGLILTDSQGVVLHVAGERDLTVAAERIGSLPGATWREDLAGNNAIGTALTQQRPAVFHFHEHWCAGWTDWTCAAAPVAAPGTDSLLGAVCVCGYRRPQDVGLVVMATHLAGALGYQLQREAQTQRLRLADEAHKLGRWFPDRTVLAVDPVHGVVWKRGAVPEELTRFLNASPPAFLAAKQRGEKEILLAGSYPALAIPIWDDSTWLGLVLIVAMDLVPRPDALQRLVAVKDGRRLLFAPEQILALRVTAGKVLLVTETGEWPTTYESLSDVRTRLPSTRFFQVDRDCLVNLAWIREIQPMFNRAVNLVLADRKGTQIPVSRRRSAALREVLPY